MTAKNTLRIYARSCRRKIFSRVNHIKVFALHFSSEKFLCAHWLGSNFSVLNASWNANLMRWICMKNVRISNSTIWTCAERGKTKSRARVHVCEKILIAKRINFVSVVLQASSIMWAELQQFNFRLWWLIVALPTGKTLDAHSKLS